MTTLAQLNATRYEGLQRVRNAILDFCCNAEKAQAIIAQVLYLTEAIEKEHGLKDLLWFELRHSCHDETIECLDIHVLNKARTDSLGKFRLYYRDADLTPLTAAQQAQLEQIPARQPGLKLKNISPFRMRRMITNSTPLLTPSAVKFATTIVDAFMESTMLEATKSSNDVTFQLDVHKTQITLHSFVNNKYIFRVSLPLAWFDKKQTVEQVQGTEDHDYLFEPRSIAQCA